MKDIKFAFSLCLIVLCCMNVTAQYYIYDTVPQYYEILSIEKSRKSIMHYYSETVRMIKSRDTVLNQDFHTKDSKIKDINKKRRYIQCHLSYNKNGYVLLLKHIESGRFFDVAVGKLKNVQGEKLAIHQVYRMKLYCVNERDMIGDICDAWNTEIDGAKVTVHIECWTRNVYVSPNLKGLKYNPDIDFAPEQVKCSRYLSHQR